MNESDPEFGQRFRQHPVAGFRSLVIEHLRFLDQRADPVGLLPGLAGRPKARDNVGPARIRQHDRGDGFATRRKFVDHRRIEIGVGGHRERARNRRGRHDELVWVSRRRHTLVAQRHALVHTEAVLLVDHDQRQSVKLDALLE